MKGFYFATCASFMGKAVLLTSMGISSFAWSADMASGNPEALESSLVFTKIVQAPQVTQQRRQRIRTAVVWSGMAITAASGVLTYKYWAWQENHSGEPFNLEQAVWEAYEEMGPSFVEFGNKHVAPLILSPYLLGMTLAEPVRRWVVNGYGWLRGVNPPQEEQNKANTRGRIARYESYIKSRVDLPTSVQDRLLGELRAAEHYARACLHLSHTTVEIM